MGHYGLYGKLKAQQGKREALVAILLQAAELMRTAKGCHLYLVGKRCQRAEPHLGNRGMGQQGGS